MADGVGRQFVKGQDHIGPSGVREPGLAGLRLHFWSQRVERTGIEGHIKHGRRVTVSHAKCGRCLTGSRWAA